MRSGNAAASVARANLHTPSGSRHETSPTAAEKRARWRKVSAAGIADHGWRRTLRCRAAIAILSRPIEAAALETPMTQTSNRFFDEAARLMNDAAGVAQGVRREFDTLFRSQAERILSDLDVVRREEFEAVKEMARLAREENEALKARIAALEAKAGAQGGQR
jgi:BMFP domain-containing protein YqiC